MIRSINQKYGYQMWCEYEARTPLTRTKAFHDLIATRATVVDSSYIKQLAEAIARLAKLPVH
jgi:hypothetical protein